MLSINLNVTTGFNNHRRKHPLDELSDAMEYGGVTMKKKMEPLGPVCI